METDLYTRTIISVLIDKIWLAIGDEHFHWNWCEFPTCYLLSNYL